MRACTVAANYDYPIIRIDTNQGVYGLGEVRDAGVKGIAPILKAHILGKNPLEIESILASIRQFAGQGRMGGGYSAVDMALHDIAGKVYGVPAWRLIGARKRNRIRIHCDTTGHKDPKIYGTRMLQRKQMGFTFFKMDLYTSMVEDRPGAVNENGAATEKGLKYLCEYIAAVRGASTTPVLTGEDVFGLEGGFLDMIDNQAVDMPWWSGLVNGLPKPIVQKGYIEVPGKPGLGVELNEAVVK